MMRLFTWLRTWFAEPDPMQWWYDAIAYDAAELARIAERQAMRRAYWERGME